MSFTHPGFGWAPGGDPGGSGFQSQTHAEVRVRVTASCIQLCHSACCHCILQTDVGRGVWVCINTEMDVEQNQGKGQGSMIMLFEKSALRVELNNLGV